MVAILTVMSSTVGSSLPSGAITAITAQFNVQGNQAENVLPISIFLLGYVLGPLVCSPISETYGRKSVTLISYFIFTVFTMACALAPNWPALIVFRLMCGVGASSALVVTPGIFADMYRGPVARGRAMAIFMGVCSTTQPKLHSHHYGDPWRASGASPQKKGKP